MRRCALVGGTLRAIKTTVVDVAANGGTLTLDYDESAVYRVTVTASTTLAISGWPASGVVARQEILAVDWGDVMTLPSSWDWGAAGVPDFPSTGRLRLILRSDDGGQTVDARLAVNVGSAAYASITDLPSPNLLDHSGRFEQVAPTAMRLPGTAINADIFEPYNGSIFADAGRFINGRYGFNAPQSVQDLMTAMGRTPSEARYGAEFWLLEITCGSGTGASRASPSGTSYSAYTLAKPALFGFGHWATGVCWARNLDGYSTIRGGEVSKNGGEPASDFELTAADGWTHLRLQNQLSRGYDAEFLALSGNPGDRIQIAMPAIFAGRVDPGIHTAPLPAAPLADEIPAKTIDAAANGDTLTLDYDATRVYRVTATADTTIEITGWPEVGIAAAQELVAVDWGAYVVTLPSSWDWGAAGVPDFPSAGRARLILRSDDAGQTVDAMLAWSAS